ncbi:MAG TPA: aldo/keto reductase [Methanoregulaceae archaeon]|nr:aldo/keto reductase [Methanoregulaceae archaeon]
MLYRSVPKTGDRLSILGFGCMRFPSGKRGGIDEERVIRQIRHAIDLGVNYFDTAPIYHMGKSEPLLAKALAGGYRERVRIATKLPPWSVNRRADMNAILAGQLRTLQTDHIDYYLLHGLTGSTWKRMLDLGVLEFLDSAREDGRVRNAGFSFHGDLTSFKKIIDAYDWQFCQIQYNYLDETNQAGTEGLRYAASSGLAVMVMEPLRGGNLASPVPPEVQKVWDEAAVQRSPAEWALRWVWDHPEVTVVLSGMNDENHIEENIKVAGTVLPCSLTEEERAVIEEARQTYARLMKVPCTGCRYCMPCPSGVNIPECFAAYNQTGLFPESGQARFQYLFRVGGVVGEGSYAGLCKRCGKCSRVCPQHIDIPIRLKEVSQELEGYGMGFKVRAIKGVLWCYNQAARIKRRMGREPM